MNMTINEAKEEYEKNKRLQERDALKAKVLDHIYPQITHLRSMLKILHTTIDEPHRIGNDDLIAYVWAMWECINSIDKKVMNVI